MSSVGGGLRSSGRLQLSEGPTLQAHLPENTILFANEIIRRVELNELQM